MAFMFYQEKYLRANSENRAIRYSRESISDSLFFLLLVVAIFFPSSVDGDFGSLGFALVRFVFIIVVLFSFGFRYFKITWLSILTFSFITCLYLFYSIVSEYSEYAFGYVLSLAPILILALLRVKRNPSEKWVLRSYYTTVFLIFVIGYLGFIVPELADFRVNFYSGGYDGLAERFQVNFIPVSIFVSHSYAGFFYFLILLASSHLISRGFSKIVNGVFIATSLISMLLLMSGAAYFFFLYSLCFLLFLVFFSRNRNYFSIYAKVLFFVVSVPISLYFGLEIVSDFIDRIIGDSGNGLLSRYGDGVLKANIEYIYNNPLMGIGFSYSEDFYYTDSDYILTALKLGVVGGCIYFIYLFMFLYDSLRRNAGLTCFVFIVVGIAAFMVSMPVSNFYRTTPFFLLLVLLFDVTATSKNFSYCNKN